MTKGDSDCQSFFFEIYYVVFFESLDEFLILNTNNLACTVSWVNNVLANSISHKCILSF